MQSVESYYLSLGSNLGDRMENLRTALRMIRQAGIELRNVSSVYETEPVDNTEQPWFLNCVAEVGTTQDPLSLLNTVQLVERQLGRKRVVPKGPRTIDIDILLCGDRRMETPGLTLPHPGMLRRRFVLEPLREIGPSVSIPGSGKTVERACTDLTDQTVVRRLSGRKLDL